MDVNSRSRRRWVCSVHILLALGALASLGLSGYNSFYRMTAKGMLVPQLPERAEQSHFDTISKRAYAASLVQHEIEVTSGDRNVTWERRSGGLDDADRSLCKKSIPPHGRCLNGD